MEKESLGLIETVGLIPAIEAADAGSKAANVVFRGMERARGGLITVMFVGDVAAVRAAVTAGAVAARAGRQGYFRSRDCPTRSPAARHAEWSQASTSRGCCYEGRRAANP